MNSIDTLATFFGWCIVINLVLLTLAFFVFTVVREDFARLMSKLFGISTEESKITLFRMFHLYRLLFIVFSVVPYLALKAMS